jgi:amidase
MSSGQAKTGHHTKTKPKMAIVSGLPATVAPVGLSESGLPVGVQIIGARFEDRTTIAFAQGLSELVGGFVTPPGYED